MCLVMGKLLRTDYDRELLLSRGRLGAGGRAPGKRVELPDYPAEAVRPGSERYDLPTTWDRAVAEYAGMGLLQVDALPLGTWLTLRRDAFITRMRSTPKGCEWLDNAWRLEQTDMDSRGLREAFCGV
jgi:hypothetical protein